MITYCSPSYLDLKYDMKGILLKSTSWNTFFSTSALLGPCTAINPLSSNSCTLVVNFYFYTNSFRCFITIYLFAPLTTILTDYYFGKIVAIQSSIMPPF